MSDDNIFLKEIRSLCSGVWKPPIDGRVLLIDERLQHPLIEAIADYACDCISTDEFRRRISETLYWSPSMAKQCQKSRREEGLPPLKIKKFRYPPPRIGETEYDLTGEYGAPGMELGL